MTTRTPSARRPSALAIATLLAAMASAASAQTNGTWTTNATAAFGDTGNWSDSTKWTATGVPSGGGNATFGGYANNRSIALDGNFTVGTLTIVPRTVGFTSTTFALTGANTLTINSGFIVGGGTSISIAPNLNIAADQTWNTLNETGAAALTLNGVVSGAGRITRTANVANTSAGIITFSGANTFSGGITQNATLNTTRLGSSSTVGSGSITNGPLGTGTVTLNAGTLSSSSTTARSISNNVVIGGNVVLGDTSNNGALTFSDTGLTTPTTFTLGSATNGNVTRLRTQNTGLTFDQVIAESGGTGQSVNFATTSGTPTVTINRTKTATGNILSGGVALVLANGAAQSGSLIGVNGSFTATGSNKFSSGALISDNTALIATDAINYSAVAGGKAAVYNNARVSFATDQTQATVAGLFTSDSQVRLGLGSGSGSATVTENYNQSAIGNGRAGLVSASTGTISYNGTLTAGSDNTYRVGGGLGTLAVGNALTGSGNNLSVEGGGTATSASNNTFSGTTTVNSALTLSGAAGALSATSGITVNNNSLTLDNTTANANRLANSAGITLNRGTLAMNGSTTAIAESIGTLTINSGYNIISMGTAAGTNNTKSITTNTLARTAGSVALFRGDSFGLPSFGGNASTRNLVIVNTAPTGANFIGGGGAGNSTTLSIIPWARTGTGTTATGGNFLTFDSSNNSLRPLLTAEFNSAADTTWGATDNVRQTVAATGTTTLLAANRTVNSVILSNSGATATTVGSLGGFTLDVTSGAVDLFHNVAQNFTLNTGTLNFGTAEGIITNSGASGSATALSAVIAGSGGVSFFANNSNGQLNIGGTNTFTGGITVGSNGNAVIGVSNDTNFGNAANSITHAGGTLQYFSAFTSARDVALLANVGSDTLANNTTSSTVTLTGNITGAGLLRLINNASTVGTGGFSLGGASSTYSGGTQIEGINVSTTTNGALGTGTVTLIGANGNAAALTVGGAGIAPTLGGLRGTDGTVTVTTTDAGNAATLTVGSNNADTVFNGVIAQGAGKTASLTKTGTGTLVLGGGQTYTGTTTVNQGTLNVLGSLADASAVTVNGGTYTVGASDTVGAVTLTNGTINGSGTLTGSSYATNNGTISAALAGSGALTQSTGTTTLSGASSYTGGTTVSSGVLNVTGSLADSGAVTVNGGTYTVGASDTVGAVTLTNGTINGSGTLTGSSYAVENGTISAALAGGAALSKSTGGTVALTGTNTYGGGTTITGGLINFTAPASFGSGNITLNGGGVQWASSYSGGDLSSGRTITIATGNGTFDTNGNNISLAGTTVGNGGSGQLIKAGSGNLTIAGITNTGGTSVQGGSLSIGSGGATGNISTSSGTTTGFAGTSTYAGSISGAGNVAVSSGNVTFSGNSNYSGTTGVSGTSIFTVNGDLTGTGAVTVNSGATLKGGGSIAGSTTVQSGGFLAPGTSPGSLVFGNNLYVAGTVEIELGGTAFTLNGTEEYDRIKLSGTSATLDLTGSTLNVVSWLSFVPSPGDKFGIFQLESGASITSTLGGFAEGDTVATIGGQAIKITYVADFGDSGAVALTGGNDIALYTAIPEPNTYAVMAGFGALGLALWTRRRKQAKAA